MDPKISREQCDGQPSPSITRVGNYYESFAIDIISVCFLVRISKLIVICVHGRRLETNGGALFLGKNIGQLVSKHQKTCNLINNSSKLG